MISRDEHPRCSTTLETLGKLKSFVKADGTITVSNTFGVNDGAYALWMASEVSAYRNGPALKAELVAMVTVGLGIAISFKRGKYYIFTKGVGNEKR